MRFCVCLCVCVCYLCCVSLIPRTWGLQGLRGTDEARAAVACQPAAPAAPLPFSAPHMVLQCWLPGGLLVLRHPGPGPATRPLLPPVSPLHRGPSTLCPPPLLFICLSVTADLSSSFCPFCLLFFSCILLSNSYYYCSQNHEH